MDEDDDDLVLEDDSTPTPPLQQSHHQQPAASSTAQQPLQPDHTSADEQTSRRKKIQEIMADASLSQHEKSKAVQSLMDGRRRSMSSQVSSQNSSFHSFQSDESVNTGGDGQRYASLMARAAAQAHDYFSSDDDNDGDAIMGDAHGGAPEDVVYGYNNHGDRSDERSVASSVTHTSFQSTHSTSYGRQQPQPNQSQTSSNSNDIPRGMTYRQVHGRSYSLQDWSDLDRAAAAANTTIFAGTNAHPAQINRMMELSRPQCTHYDRHCTIVSPCCGLAFGCRICHDECPVLPMPLHLRRTRTNSNDNAVNAATATTTGATTGPSSSSDRLVAEQMSDLKHKSKMDRRRSMPLDLEEEEENHHPIDRFLIREVICRSCYTRQSSKTNHCTNCNVQFGEYHCNICNLWMSAREAPYHCADCGFCRVGGRENFRHCDDCGMCIDTLLFDDHNCKAGKYMSNCPVCQEDLFSSRYASHEMPCGHAIHWHCFKELTSYDTRCPVCKKTAETPEHMQSTWSAIAMGIALQPVPTEMARVVNIFCNDCEKNDSNRRWHFLGVRCMNCMSFNTNVEQIVLQGREAAVYLDEIEASNANEQGVPANIAVAAIPSGGSSADAMMEDDIPSAEFSSGSAGNDTIPERHF